MKRRTVDMLNGSLLPNILLYTLPLIASGLLQFLYSAADMIVVARFAGGTALAAVGSTGSLVNLIVNVFIGMSVGAGVAIARAFGAGNRKDIHESVHTAMGISIISGIVTMVIGLIIAPAALRWMGTPPEVIDQSTLYLRIYFLGMPAMMVYNFGAAILRSVGDTRRPLYILALAGLVNVGLNLLLVIVFHLDVAGVAIATTVSQVISAVLAVLCLMRAEGVYRYRIRKTRIYKDKLLEMLRLGIPAGLQGSIFSISNILIQSSINSFGAAAVAGGAAASTVDGAIYISMNAMYQTCMAFTAQNVGARKPERLKKIVFTCLALVTVIGLIIGFLVVLFGEPLLTLFTSTSVTDTTVSPADILREGMVRLTILGYTYFLCGIMEVLVGAMRGMGSSWTPMIVSIAGVCGIRIVYIYTVFTFWYHSLPSLYLSYTISWVITAAIHAVCLFVKQRKIVRELTTTDE
ncbi:MAG: MATE family efflux transporter [Ruminococcaceae bacterium]|nr:MATE family efflux transporter [Oscillospiraceae bacterium]